MSYTSASFGIRDVSTTILEGTGAIGTSATTAIAVLTPADVDGKTTLDISATYANMADTDSDGTEVKVFRTTDKTIVPGDVLTGGTTGTEVTADQLLWSDGDGAAPVKTAKLTIEDGAFLVFAVVNTASPNTDSSVSVSFSLGA